jgi:hypothetical protein
MEIRTVMGMGGSGVHPIQINTEDGVVEGFRSTLLTFDLMGGVNRSPAQLYQMVNGGRVNRVLTVNANHATLPFVAVIHLLLPPS